MTDFIICYIFSVLQFVIKLLLSIIIIIYYRREEIYLYALYCNTLKIKNSVMEPFLVFRHFEMEILYFIICNLYI